jgi:hypothetical protein
MTTSAPSPALIVPPPDTGTNAVVLEELRDVKPPVPIVNLWPYGIGAALLALLAAALLYGLLRRRRLPRPPALVVVPPHRRALDRLRAALDLLQDPKAFTICVADTLRCYLEERFDLKAPERTSEEFLEEIRTSPVLTPRQVEILADFLTRCVLVKFAQGQPSEPELRGLWDSAMNLVSDTVAPSDASARSDAP